MTATNHQCSRHAIAVSTVPPLPPQSLLCDEQRAYIYAHATANEQYGACGTSSIKQASETSAYSERQKKRSWWRRGRTQKMRSFECCTAQAGEAGEARNGHGMLDHGQEMRSYARAWVLEEGREPSFRQRRQWREHTGAPNGSIVHVARQGWPEECTGSVGNRRGEVDEQRHEAEHQGHGLRCQPRHAQPHVARAHEPGIA